MQPTVAQWWQGARPRTLPAAIAPVLVGTSLAIKAGSFLPLRAFLALVVALALQVGVNYANDYSDGIRGTDRNRVGPIRLVGQGIAPAPLVKRAAILSLVLAAVAGFILVALTGEWWLLAIGAAAIAAAWLYTGGPRPYGYAGLGELFVFLFFGLVPVVGTFYVQTLTVTDTSVTAAIGVGLFICAILIANNLRDIPTDEASGKRTLAVRLGDHRTRLLYASAVLAPFAVVVALALQLGPWTLLGFVALPAILPALRAVLRGATGPVLVPVLKATGTAVLIYGLFLSAGIVL